MAVPCRVRMTAVIIFDACAQPWTSAERPLVLLLSYLNKGGTAVDLALRLNVLAVTAVFLFVGAVLLGAF